MHKMMQNAVIFNKKINISCITVIAAVLLCAFCACTGGRGTGQESTAAPVLLTPSVEPTAGDDDKTFGSRNKRSGGGYRG